MKYYSVVGWLVDNFCQTFNIMKVAQRQPVLMLAQI